jgi:DNA-binding beta-propeller fold protein YncE
LSVKGDAGRSTVEWKGAFYRGFVNNDPPPELSDEAAVKAVTGVYRAGLDALKAKVERTVPVGRRPYAVGLAQDRAFVTDQYAAAVPVFDTKSWAPLKTISAGEYPEGIAADESGRFVFVACWEENTLERIDVNALAVTGRAVTGRAVVGDGPGVFGKFLR